VRKHSTHCQQFRRANRVPLSLARKRRTPFSHTENEWIAGADETVAAKRRV